MTCYVDLINDTIYDFTSNILNSNKLVWDYIYVDIEEDLRVNLWMGVVGWMLPNQKMICLISTN